MRWGIGYFIGCEKAFDCLQFILNPDLTLDKMS